MQLYNHNLHKTKIIDWQIVNTNSKIKATVDLFIRLKRIIFKEIRQQNCTCTGFNKIKIA